MPELVIYLLLGSVSGMLGGMLGIGGGVVIVPALIIIFELIARHPLTEVTVIAVATSMACIVFTSLAAAITQMRAGKVRWDLAGKLIVFFLLGSFTAGLTAPGIDAPLLRALIGLFLMLVGLVMSLNWQPNPDRAMPGLVGSAPIGFAGGYVSGIAGIAGGNVIVPTLVYFNTPIHNATATSSAMGVAIAAAGAAGYALGSTSSLADNMLGLVDLNTGLWIVLGAVVAAPAGVKLAHRVSAAKLKRLFGYFLMLIAMRMLYTSWVLFTDT